MRKFITASALIAAAAITTVPAFAQTGAGIGSVVNCDASGNRQAYGAVLGGIAGAVVGNNVSKGDNAPLVGALGAAAGSISVASNNGPSPNKGHNLDVQSNGDFFATTNVNVRSGPSTRNARITTLAPGQRVTVTGYNGAWARVNTGRTTGYVNTAYLAQVQ